MIPSTCREGQGVVPVFGEKGWVNVEGSKGGDAEE